MSEKLVLVIFESPGGNVYKGHEYPYDIWYGCMFPVEKEFHRNALLQFPILAPHPVLPKWLYLPLDTEGFDDLVTEILQQVTRPNSFWGSIPKQKKKKTALGKAPPQEKISSKIDTRKPRMFSDEPAEVTLQKAVKISDLKNLGPSTEREFHKAGIKSAQKFIEMGWKKAMVKLVKANAKNRHSLFAYALIGALTNTEWNRISDSEKQEAKDFVRALPDVKKKKKS